MWRLLDFLHWIYVCTKRFACPTKGYNFVGGCADFGKPERPKRLTLSRTSSGLTPDGKKANATRGMEVDAYIGVSEFSARVANYV